ncbi:MAG: UspA domain-containing protein [Planctomycetota bacterium]|nr:MAG: UspA domain-containing protein [Planctomycetota bacterium]
MLKVQKILCPTDFSEFGEHALRYACELAEKFQAEVHLLNVLQDYDAIAPGTGETFAPFTEWLPELRKQSEEQLAKLPGPEWTGKLRVLRTTSVGAPVDEITKYAKAHQIDLIVQGTHGRRGVKHMLLGSVAENIVRYAPCPVLTVRKS